MRKIEIKIKTKKMYLKINLTNKMLLILLKRNKAIILPLFKIAKKQSKIQLNNLKANRKINY